MKAPYAPFLLILLLPGCYTPKVSSPGPFGTTVPGFSQARIAPDTFEVMYVGRRGATAQGVRSALERHVGSLCPDGYALEELREAITVVAHARTEGEFSASGLAKCYGDRFHRHSVTLSTGEGLMGPFFDVYLSWSGALLVTKRAPPVRAEGGLTEQKIGLRISEEEVAETFQLAASSQDFADGCGLDIAHGTSARLQVSSTDGAIEYTCHRAMQWPVGPQTKLFLDSINRHLPEHLHAY